MADTETKSLNIKLNIKMHQRLKVAAAVSNQTIKDFISCAIEEKIDKENKNMKMLR